VHHSRNLVVRTRLYPGVRETLDRFRLLPMAVVTNKPVVFSEPILEQLGVRGYFRMIIGADSGLPLKPEPDAFNRIMAECGVAPQDTVIVGDGTTDIRGGKAAGAVTCAVTYGFRSEELLRREGPDYLIPAFSGLTGLFLPAGGNFR